MNAFDYDNVLSHVCIYAQTQKYSLPNLFCCLRVYGSGGDQFVSDSQLGDWLAGKAYSPLGSHQLTEALCRGLGPSRAPSCLSSSVVQCCLCSHL